MGEQQQGEQSIVARLSIYSPANSDAVRVLEVLARVAASCTLDGFSCVLATDLIDEWEDDDAVAQS